MIATRRRCWAAVCVAVTLSCIGATAARGERITNGTPEFTLDVPPGYERIQGASANEMYTFVLRGRGNDGGLPDAMVDVQALNGTIGPERPILPSDAPAGARETVAKWAGHDVWVLESNVTRSGITLACRTVQIPLAGEAVQVVVAVPPDRESTADGILAQFLAGLNGPSNWPPALSDAERETFHVRRVVTSIVMSLAMVSVIALIIVLRRRRRRSRTSDGKPAAVIGRDERSSRAFKAGLITAVVVLVLLWTALILADYLGYAAPVTPADAYQRGYDEMMGTAKFSGFCGLIAAGVSYAMDGIRNRRRAPVGAVTPRSTPAPTIDSNRPDPAQALFDVRDDRE